MFRAVGGYWSSYGINLKVVYNPIKWWGPELATVVFSGLNEILWPAYYIGGLIRLFHDCPNLRAYRIGCSDCWPFTLRQVRLGFVLLSAKPATRWYRPFLLPSSRSLPCGGTWTVCWEVRTCAPWGFGNLQLHFLPRRVTKPTVILKAGEGEGKDLTAGMLQPHVQWP